MRDLHTALAEREAAGLYCHRRVVDCPHLGGFKSPASAGSFQHKALGVIKEYRRGRHTAFELHVHLVWCTKYRRKALKKDTGILLRDLCRQICSDLGVEILSGVVAKEHVHVLVDMLPQVSVSKLVQS